MRCEFTSARAIGSTSRNATKTMLLLCGGAKSSQARDIGRAKLMLAAIDKE
jgi:putative component of toxin-antitoxin plasmid stabilization module